MPLVTPLSDGGAAAAPALSLPGDAVDQQAVLSSRGAQPLLSPTRRARGGRWTTESPRIDALPGADGPSVKGLHRGEERGLGRRSVAGAIASRWMGDRTSTSARAIAVGPLSPAAACTARAPPRLLPLDALVASGEPEAEAWALHVPRREAASPAGADDADAVLRSDASPQKTALDGGAATGRAALQQALRLPASAPAPHTAIAIPVGEDRDFDRDLASDRLVTWRLPPS